MQLTLQQLNSVCAWVEEPGWSTGPAQPPLHLGQPHIIPKCFWHVEQVSPTPCSVLGGRASGCDPAWRQNGCEKTMPWVRVGAPYSPSLWEKSFLGLPLLCSCPRCDSEIKKKKNSKINFPTWHILKGTVNWLYNYISKSLEDYTEGWTLQNLNVSIFFFFK